MRWNWGTGIAAVYTAFAVATTGLVVFAMGRPVDLVAPDYYARSLRQDERLQAMRNARDLGPAFSLTQTEGRAVTVAMAPAHAAAAKGTITLYRASDAAADRVFELSPDADGRQHVPLDGLLAGHWIVQLDWSAAGRTYYAEQAVLVR